MVLEDSGKNAWLKTAVARALGDTKDARAAGPLMEDLKDENEQVRAAAAESLGKIGDPRAVRPLTDTLQDESGKVRAAAGEALVTIGTPAVTPLYEVFIHAFKARDSRLRDLAVDALVKIGKEAVNPLNHPLWDKNSEPELRYIVVRALGKIGDPRAVGDLVHALKDENAQVRADAAEFLGKIGDPDAVEPLNHTLMKEKDSRVKSAVIKALKEIEKK